MLESKKSLKKSCKDKRAKIFDEFSFSYKTTRVLNLKSPQKKDKSHLGKLEKY
jgi:hypothetical protein